jgi:hypothetical protein
MQSESMPTEAPDAGPFFHGTQSLRWARPPAGRLDELKRLGIEAINE